MAAFIDWTGKTWGYLTFLHRVRNRGGRCYWAARCSRGGRGCTGLTVKHPGAATSCGCAANEHAIKLANRSRIDRTGETVGNITLMSYDAATRKYLCRCNRGGPLCRVYFNVKWASVQTGNTKSCGCLLREHSKQLCLTRISNKLNPASVAAILFLREKKGWLQSELAEEFGVSQAAISALLTQDSPSARPGSRHKHVAWRLPFVKADKGTRQQIYRLIRATQDRALPHRQRKHSEETRQKIARAQHVRWHVKRGIKKAGCEFCPTLNRTKEKLNQC